MRELVRNNLDIIQLRRKVAQLGGVDNLTDEQCENLVKKYKLYVSPELKAYMEYSKLMLSYESLQRDLAELGEGSIADVICGFKTAEELTIIESYANQIGSCMAELRQQMSELYPLANAHAEFIGVKLLFS